MNDKDLAPLRIDRSTAPLRPARCQGASSWLVPGIALALVVAVD